MKQTPISRRNFIGLAAGGVAAGTLLSALPARAIQPAIRAVAFDAFPIFDPRPVFLLAEELFPGRGTALSEAWRTRQFEYTWLRTAAGRYKNFRDVTEDALIFAAKVSKLELTDGKRRQLMDAYYNLGVWPDVLSALDALRHDGIRLAFLSNMTPEMLNAGIKNSRLEEYFEHVLSTDTVRTYKPAPAAYQMGPDAFGLHRDEIAFAAFAGWDAAGARLFGYPTFWVNRLQAPAEELDVTSDATGSNLTALVEFVRQRQ